MTNRRLLGFAGLAVFLLVWEAAAASGLIPNALLPPPSSLPATLLSEVELGFWQAMVFASLTHYLTGLVVGTVLGMAAGIAVALFPRFDAAQYWVARVLRPIPPLAWIPFAIIWFGVSETAAAFIIAIGIFWINYFTASAAVRAVDPDLVELAVSFGQGSLFRRLIKVILPAASPGLLSGMRAGLGQGWMTVVAAELFGITGIGSRMMEAAGLLATQVVIVYMLTIALLYGLSDMAFVAMQNRVLRWQR